MRMLSAFKDHCTYSNCSPDFVVTRIDRSFGILVQSSITLTVEQPTTQKINDRVRKIIEHLLYGLNFSISSQRLTDGYSSRYEVFLRKNICRKHSFGSRGVINVRIAIKPTAPPRMFFFYSRTLFAIEIAPKPIPSK